MRKLLLLLPLIALLTACQSKRDICAEFAAEADYGPESDLVAARLKAAKKLGIELEPADLLQKSEGGNGIIA